jgi:hypothetical protein
LDKLTLGRKNLNKDPYGLPSTLPTNPKSSQTHTKFSTPTPSFPHHREKRDKGGKKESMPTTQLFKFFSFKT